MRGVHLLPGSPGLSLCGLKTMAISSLHCQASKKSRQSSLLPLPYSPIHASLPWNLASTPICAAPGLSMFLSPLGPLGPYLALPCWPRQPPLQPQFSGDLSHFQGHCAIRTPNNAGCVPPPSPPVSNFIFWEMSSKPWRTEAGSL